MAVPFGKLKVIDAEARSYEVRDMLKSFAKAMFDRPGAIMQTFDSTVSDFSDNNEGNAFMAAVPNNPFDCDCYVMPGRLSILSLLRGTSASADIQKLLKRFAISNSQGASLMILFKVKHLGIFVAHNMSLPYTSTPRIVIASSNRGTDAIQIQSLSNFAIDNSQKKK